MKTARSLPFYKKKAFLLLEVLIAFSLVALFSSLLIKRPMLFLRKQVESLQLTQAEYFSQIAYGEIKLLLMENKIPWEKMSHDKASAPKYPLPQENTQLCPQEQYFTLYVTKEAEGRDNSILRLCQATIYFKYANVKEPLSFSYHFFLKKGQKNVPAANKEESNISEDQPVKENIGKRENR